ncbi:RNI-like protein [Teratosphaeria nubilosa]|uniref:RNI-like protein n=1 Tax=Teratosphaeria nubilosa TaxID=161662 RepID=A0A6G1L0Y1_9PEZI|nr:RNI-like protein [Teratosphaeria nubilosa]
MMRRHQYRTSQTAPRTANGSSDPSLLLHSYDAALNPSRPARSSPLGSSTIGGLPLELLDRLKAFPLFQSAPETFLVDIGKSLRPSIYQPSQEIICEGEDAKAMYWLVRGSVRVTSRDGESTYAELRPGAFFGEIGILMDMPRTASIVASIRSLVVRLNKEDIQKVLPAYPEVERSIRDEALERLAILERQKKERSAGTSSTSVDLSVRPPAAPRKRSRDWMAGDVEMGEAGSLSNGEVLANKRRKSPSPGIADLAASSALSEPPLTIRSLLKELPLFAGLPSEILHFLGVNAQHMSFPPFTEILTQDSQGREVYFIIKGEVEVLTNVPDSRRASAEDGTGANGVHQEHRQKVRARLRAGQYFGEVTSLSLAPKRTATVRSVHTVECLLISGEILDDLWRRCGPDLRRQVEGEAKRRLSAARKDDDVLMTDAGVDGGPVGGGVAINEPGSTPANDEEEWRKGLPTVKFDEPPLDDQPTPVQQMEPADPDPFFNPDLDNMRAKSRRSSLAPPVPASESHANPLSDMRTPSPPVTLRIIGSSPLKPGAKGSPASSARLSPTATRRPSLVRLPSNIEHGKLPESILILIFQHLELLELMRLRLVSVHWWNLLNDSPDILHFLDLSIYNRKVTDQALCNAIVPFTGSRPKYVDLSNCFHVSDEGFKILVDACGERAKMWRMKSVWDVSAPAILALIDKAKGLEEIDLSNCRKAGDNLLARVVGWVVPDKPANQQMHIAPQPHQAQQNGKRPQTRRGMPVHQQSNNVVQEQPPPGTVIGASKLKRLTLSYCKHIQDRSMAHIAVHASDRVESLDLTRCTSISDAGFHSWGVYEFKNLRRLVLADCTYLSDQAIVGVVGGCRGLRELDLSFCCALSDTATEVLALGLPQLRRLNMAFCGSAISDNSLRCIGLHLLELRYLSVRGCVRVTGQGVESVVEGCRSLEELDVSQCKNLKRWLDFGGIRKVNGDPGIKGVEGANKGRGIKFDVVADGTWRVDGRW